MSDLFLIFLIGTVGVVVGFSVRNLSTRMYPMKSWINTSVKFTILGAIVLILIGPLIFEDLSVHISLPRFLAGR